MDRGLYGKIEFRAAMHPSESIPFFVARILAFCLNFREGLEFSAGISTPEEPALFLKGMTGGYDLWVDIGNPSAKRVHKASKSSKTVRIYTHKDARMLAKELKEERVHRLGEIGLFSFEQKFLNDLGARLGRDNRWEFTHQEGELYLGIGQASFQGRMDRIVWEEDP